MSIPPDSSSNEPVTSPFALGDLPPGVLLFAYAPNERKLLHAQGDTEALLGAKLVTLIADGNLFLRHVHSDDRFPLLERLERAMAGRDTLATRYRWIRPDTSTQVWIDCRGILSNGIFYGLMHEVAGAQGLAPFDGDVSAATLAALPLHIVSVDRDLRLRYVSPGLAEQGFQFGDPHFRLEEFRVGALLPALFASEQLANSFLAPLSAVLSGESTEHVVRIPTANRVFEITMRPLITDAGLDGAICSIEDVSELAEKEQQLGLLQRAEALRVLASGLAHSLNNALQTIVGHAAAIQTHPDQPDLVHKASQAIIETVARCSEFTRYLRGAEDSSTTMIPIDINLIAMASVNRIEDLFSSGSKVAVMFGSTPKVRGHHEIFVDIVEKVLRYVCMGLNAHSLSYVSVKTREVRVREGEFEGLRPGLYAQLSVASSNQEKPDSPPPLRLLSSAAISTEGELSELNEQVRRYGGAIISSQSAGGGLSISILLPSMESDSPSIEGKTEAAPELLIVDDDRMVLQTVVSLLRDQGFRCVSAEDHQQALTLLKTHSGSLRMVIVDALMPGGDGASLVRKMKRLHPDLRIVGFSGAQPEHWKPLLEAGAEKVLPKPVNPMTLRRTVEQCLEPPRAAHAG